MKKRIYGLIEKQIVTSQPYTKADLCWVGKKSRNTVEMTHGPCRLAIAGSKKMKANDSIPAKVYENTEYKVKRSKTYEVFTLGRSPYRQITSGF